MNEKQFNKKLIKGFKIIRLRSFEACRLPDVPDLWAIVPGVCECWIETKMMTSDQVTIPFRHGQPDWAQKMVDDGGMYFVLVVLKEKFVHVLHARTTIKLLATENLF